MPGPAASPRRHALHTVIFEARTPAGRVFDAALIVTILTSVIVVMLATVEPIRQDHETLLLGLEWAFTLLFTVEYVVRLSVVARAREYATSFFGVIDLLAILPTYLSLLVPGAQVLLVIRLVRVLRVFHVFEFAKAEGAGRILLSALRSSRYPVAVFLSALVTVVVFLGALMYLVEGERNSAFASIPMSIYWAVVTVTTLGYGDIVPTTALGRTLTTGIVFLGYWVLAVPVGIISISIAEAARSDGGEERPACPACGLGGHEADARYCRGCGAVLQASEA